MRNYAGHRLAPWLAHVMVSRQETARALLTPGEVMQLRRTTELSSGGAPVSYEVPDDHAAFAGGDLLVRIKAEHAGAAERSDRALLRAGGAGADVAAEAFAAVFNEREFVTPCDRFDFDHAAGMAKRFDGNDRLCPRRDRGFELGRVEVEALCVDVDEFGRCADIENAIGRRNEAEWRRDHFIAGPDVGGKHREMKATRAVRHADRMRAAADLGDMCFELFEFRADRKNAAAHHVGDSVDFALGNIGLRERNLHAGRLGQGRGRMQRSLATPGVFATGGDRLNLKSMSSRFNPGAASPDGYKAMMVMETYLASAGLGTLLHLVKLRVSQINGCAFCIDMHWKDLRAAGESEQRLYGLDAWEESPYYDDRERAALAWAEALTKITEGHVPDAAFEHVKPHFTVKRSLI